MREYFFEIRRFISSSHEVGVEAEGWPRMGALMEHERRRTNDTFYNLEGGGGDWSKMDQK